MNDNVTVSLDQLATFLRSKVNDKSCSDKKFRQLANLALTVSETTSITHKRNELREHTEAVLDQLHSIILNFLKEYGTIVDTTTNVQTQLEAELNQLNVSRQKRSMCEKNMKDIVFRTEVIQNAIKCNSCSTIIKSVNSLDFTTCQCGNFTLGGGELFHKLDSKDKKKTYEDLVLTSSNTLADIQERLVWCVIENDRPEWKFVSELDIGMLNKILNTLPNTADNAILLRVASHHIKKKK